MSHFCFQYLRAWSGLANLNNARSYHGCEKVLRRGRDFLMVYGGSQSSIELLDLAFRQTPWVVSSVSLPAVMTKIPGHIAKVFDDQSCEMMFVESSTKMLYVCTGNYEWQSKSLKHFPVGAIPFMAIDASLFGPRLI